MNSLVSRMVIPCTIYRQSSDRYGDLSKTNGVSTTCWFRDITGLEHQTDRDTVISSSMAWLRPTESLSEGDILTIEGYDYRVIGIIIGRRLGESTAQFLKCSLKKQGATVS